MSKKRQQPAKPAGARPEPENAPNPGEPERRRQFIEDLDAQRHADGMLAEVVGKYVTPGDPTTMLPDAPVIDLLDVSNEEMDRLREAIENHRPVPTLHTEQKVTFTEVNMPKVDPDHYFGTFFDLLRHAPSWGSSEFGAGAMLFGLAISIRAATVIEIGRYTGFSTLALAGALKFIDSMPPTTPDHQFQRPEMDYADFLAPRKRKLISVDLNPYFAAELLIQAAQLQDYVQYVNADSHGLDLTPQLAGQQADLIFIDGDHNYDGVKQDVDEYVSRYLKPGGYFVLHDYFGWYNERGENGSAIARLVNERRHTHTYEQVLIDTGFMSLVVLRKV